MHGLSHSYAEAYRLSLVLGGSCLSAQDTQLAHAGSFFPKSEEPNRKRKASPEAQRKTNVETKDEAKGSPVGSREGALKRI